VQIGMRDYQGGSASDEFIELYNTTNAAIDITGWEVRYYTALSTVEPRPTLQTADASRRVKIANANGSVVLLPAHSYFVIYAGAVPTNIPQGTLTQTDALGLATTDRSLVLFSRSAATCEFTPEDAVAWGIGAFGEGPSVPRGAKDIVMQRYTDGDGTYIDANDNSNDFAMTQVTANYHNATPGARSAFFMTNEQAALLEVHDRTVATFTAEDCAVPAGNTDTPPATQNPESPPSTTIPDESEAEEEEGSSPERPQPIIPAGNLGLQSPQISELLPNPGAPLTDTADEFIELYNPNGVIFDLSGYILETGLTTKYRYTFPAGTMLPAHAFTAFFSSITDISLSNTSGQVRLIDPLGRVMIESEAYQTAKENYGWLLANGTWQWTTKPTPGERNVVSVPVTKKAKTTTATTTSAKKATPIKAASTTKPKENTEKEEKPAATAAAAPTGRSPLHPLVLAVVGGFALLYGAYEYRKDLANKFYQFRSNRAARRKAGQGAQGR